VSHLAGVLVTLIGLGLLALRKPFARLALKVNGNVWGYDFTERTVGRVQVLVVFIGLGWTVMGVLLILGLEH
jgi:hypothetical protein